MAACDGIPFSTLANSPSFQKLFHLSGFTGIPKSGNGIRNAIMNYYNSRRDEVVEIIKEHITNGKKISITLDEWTSTANRRYMNINIHSVKGRFWNLGLVRILGSATSEACLLYIQTKLQKFGISFSSDVFCLSTDGAAVMKKLGRISEKQQQLCIAHGIHLAVLEVIYQNDSPLVTAEEEQPEEDSGEDVGESGFEIEQSEVPLDLKKNLGDIVKNIRRIVKYFRISPLKEEVLKAYTKAAHGKDIALVLDVRTRWNSLLLMIERFMLLKNEVQKALIDLNEPCHINEDDFLFIEEVIRILKPVKMAVEAICMHDANLLSCDVAINFMMKKISERRTEISDLLYEALKNRITDRRTFLSDVASYLRFRKLPSSTFFTQNLSKYQLVSRIKDLVEALFELNLPTSYESDNVFMEDSSDNSTDHLAEDQEVTLEMELYNAIKLANDEGVMSKNVINQEKSLQSTIKKEMVLFENGGTRGKYLEGVYQALMTVQPTSVESERVFSSANYICSKIRSRLGDEILDVLVFLRSQFRLKR